MALNLSKTVEDFLQQHSEVRFTARQIADWIFKTYPDECAQKQKKSTAIINPIDSEAALINQIIAEIGSQRPRLQKNNPNIKTTEGRPRKYYYTERSDDSEIDAIEEQQEKVQSLPLEKDLYPMLTSYLKTEHNLYAKRIDEKCSTNNRGHKGNEWLYPDIVAMEDLAADWSSKVTACAKQYGDKKAKLWSFEVKRLINTSNVRSAFFQAVSNSSWANFSYLVAAELEERAKKELRMLSRLHGVGFILLDRGNCAESEIMIPAYERSDLDWNSINRLAEANKDFADYVEEINDFCLTGKTKVKDWD